jgi:tetratricopeptide (TPR) repeat protein
MWFPAIFAFFLFFQAPDYQADGLKALDAKNYQAAVDAFSKAAAADPGNYSLQFNLALAYSLLGKDPEAIPIYRKVLELKPGLYQAELNLGMLLLRDKIAKEAAPLLKSAASQKPTEYRPSYYLGDALLTAGDFAGAEEAFQHALSINPKAAASELGLARAQAGQQRLDDAAPHFERAAALDPSFKDSLLQLASLYEANKQDAKAIAIYKQFPENIAACEHTGELLLANNRAAEAIPPLESAVKQAPSAANRMALAQAYVKDNNPDKALPLVVQAVAEAPKDFDLRMFHAKLLRDKKNYMAAGKEFLEAAQLKPDSAEAWNEYAAMMTLTENYAEALAAYDRVRALGKETSANFFFRAIILDKLKQYKPALDNYEKFLAGSEGKYPDQEFQARQRARIIKLILSKR